MKVFLALSTFVATLAIISSSEYDEDSPEFEQTSSGIVKRTWARTSQSVEIKAVKSAFRSWAAEFNASYSSKGDRRKAQSNFLDNAATIEAHNSLPNVTFTLGHNQFSDLSKEQFAQMLIDYKKLENQNASPDNPVFSRSLPASLNYIAYLQPIQNQGRCASSYAYAPVAALEGYLKITYGITKKLSEQQIIDCSGRRNGCDGGTYNQFIDYVQNNGIMSAVSYNIMSPNKCLKAPRRSTLGNVTIDGYRQIYNDDAAIKTALYTVGPTVVCVDASGWRFYASGIYSDSTKSIFSSTCNHFVTVVGYDYTSDIPYYILRNSWGM